MWMARATGGRFASAHSFKYLCQTLSGWPDGPCLQPRVEVVWWTPAALVAGQADGGIVNRHVGRTIGKNHRDEGPGVAVAAGDQVQRQIAQSPVFRATSAGRILPTGPRAFRGGEGWWPPLNSFIRPSEKFSLSRQKVPTGCL